MIYLDPPYGIKFGSNWQVSTRKRDVKDAKAEDVTRQPEQIKAFRDTWELGIHSYLTYLRDRLAVARDLLTESGSVFVQIGDENVHLVRCLLDEVFGSENFMSLKSHSRRPASSTAANYLAAQRLSPLYAKKRQKLKYRQLCHETRTGGSEGYTYSVELPMALAGMTRRSSKPRLLPDGSEALQARQHDTQSIGRGKANEPCSRYVEYGGRSLLPDKGGWKTNEDGDEKARVAARAFNCENSLQYVRYIRRFSRYALNNIWTDTIIGSFTDEKVYVVQTITKVVERCLLMTTDPGDLVLDPTCGSGTTAYVAEQWGRRWITIDTSRVALALARTRLMAARFPYYLLADSPEGRKKEAEFTGTPPRSDCPDHQRHPPRASFTSACRTSPSRASPTTRTSRRA